MYMKRHPTFFPICSRGLSMAFCIFDDSISGVPEVRLTEP